MQGCEHVLRPLIIGKDHRQLLIKNAHHSFLQIIARGHEVHKTSVIKNANANATQSFYISKCT